MNAALRFATSCSTASQIREHLERCDQHFAPPLSSRADIHAYAGKLASKSERIEAWDGQELIGLVAIYIDDEARRAHVSNVSVDERHGGKRIGARLLSDAIRLAHERGALRISLEVSSGATRAIRLYASSGFNPSGDDGPIMQMHLDLCQDPIMSDNRNYNRELKDTAEHKYAYNFDFDVMHRYMLESFKPFFRPGNLLELGSFKGDFTCRLAQEFDDVTCVEAASDAVGIARERLGAGARIIHDTFESVDLAQVFDNIVLTHVLEHIDDPIRVLRRVNEEWLAKGGKFFLVCPNANAPSRQIAVKMGLITHNAAVTPAEIEHGHRRTYSLDTLERDATKAGLKTVHRSGIFFKSLANFQWDRLLATDIISQEYLDGCYMLGQQYPDLCSSIFLVCEKGG